MWVIVAAAGGLSQPACERKGDVEMGLSCDTSAGLTGSFVGQNARQTSTALAPALCLMPLYDEGAPKCPDKLLSPPVTHPASSSLWVLQLTHLFDMTCRDGAACGSPRTAVAKRYHSQSRRGGKRMN